MCAKWMWTISTEHNNGQNICEARCEGAARSICAPHPTLSPRSESGQNYQNAKITPKTWSKYTDIPWNISINSFNKLLFMRCVHKSLVLSSNFLGISLNWPSVLGSTSSSTKKISFSLAFNTSHVSKLIGQRLVFKTLSAYPSSVLGVRLMWIISVCSLYVKLSIRQASTEIMLLCAKSCIMMFGRCILLVSAISVKRINSAGIKCLLMMCMAAVATIMWRNILPHKIYLDATPFNTKIGSQNFMLDPSATDFA